MKNYFVLAAVWLSFSLCSQGQLSILFVDDSDDTFGNAEVFYNAISAVGYSATYYDAIAEEASPDDVMLSDYDLVIWYTSSDGTDLYLWNANEEDNEALEIYLEDGGMLWLVGLDFLFDKYGGAPYEISAGDFAYDYLGVFNYEAQTFADDFGVGVPLVEPDMNSPIPGLEEISWQFETLWYVDAVVAREGVESVYVMGDEEYVFAGKSCALYNESDVFKVLSYYFDLSLAANPAMLNANVSTVLDYFNAFVVGVEETETPVFQLYPNPNNGLINLEYPSVSDQILNLELLDLQGRVIQQYAGFRPIENQSNRIELALSPEIPNGLYVLRMQQGASVNTAVVSLIR